MGIVHTDNLAVHINLSPHGTVVGHFEIEILEVLDGEAAVDDHVALTNDHIGEIVFIRIRVLLIATMIIILLEADDVNLLFLHLREDILSDEA